MRDRPYLRAMSNTLKYGLLALGAYLLWNKIGKVVYAAYNFAFKLNRIKIVASEADYTQLQIHILIKNVTQYGVFVDGLCAQFSLNGESIGYIDTPINRMIEGHAITEVVLPVCINFTETVRTILDEIPSTIIQSWNIRIQGELGVDGKHIPADIILTAQNIEQMIVKE